MKLCIAIVAVVLLELKVVRQQLPEVLFLLTLSSSSLLCAVKLEENAVEQYS